MSKFLNRRPIFLGLLPEDFFVGLIFLNSLKIQIKVSELEFL